jgi:hypothetical protein
VLEQEPAGAGPQGVKDVLVDVVGGEDQHAGWVGDVRAGQPMGRLSNVPTLTGRWLRCSVGVIALGRAASRTWWLHGHGWTSNKAAQAWNRPIPKVTTPTASNSAAR